MTRAAATVCEPARTLPVVDDADVVVIGGGPAGIAAAIAAARLGVSVLLVERGGSLGGAAAGSLVLTWDDCDDGTQKTVGGVLDELVEAARRLGGAVVPDPRDLHRSDPVLWAKWGRWGFTDWFTPRPPGSVRPITWAACVDPEVLKHVAAEAVLNAGARLRLHSWAVGAVRGPDVTAVFVDGQLLSRDGEPVHLDAERILADGARAATRLADARA